MLSYLEVKACMLSFLHAQRHVADGGKQLSFIIGQYAQLFYPCPQPGEVLRSQDTPKRPSPPFLNPCHLKQKCSSDPSNTPLSHSNIPPCLLPQRNEKKDSTSVRGSLLPKLLIYVTITPKLKLATEGPILAISSGTSAASGFQHVSALYHSQGWQL